MSAEQMIPEVGFAPGEEAIGLSDEEHRLLQRQLVARVFVEPETLGEVLAAGLRHGHLDQPRESRALEALEGLFADGQPVSTDRALRWLQERGKAPPKFDVWLTRIVEDPLTDKPTSVASMLVEHWQWMTLFKVASIASEATRTRRWTPEEVINRLGDKLDLLRAPRHEVRTAADVMAGLMDLWEGKRGPVDTIRTGWRELDEALRFQAGRLICIGANTSMGKTATLASLIDEFAVNQQIPTALWAPEDGGEDYCARISSRRSRIDLPRLQAEVSGEVGWRELGQATADIEAAPLFIYDEGEWSALDIRAECRRLRSRGLRLVCIDQLSHLRHPTFSRPDMGIIETTRRLKKLARELRVTVVLLHQVKPEVLKRDNPRPRIGDLRDAAVENECDAVLFPFRPEYHARKPSPEMRGLLEMIIGKNRIGKRNTTIDLFFESRTASVREEDPKHGRIVSAAQQSFLDDDDDEAF